MSKWQQLKLSKLIESREKAESEIKRINPQTDKNRDRRAHAEPWLRVVKTQRQTPSKARPTPSVDSRSWWLHFHAERARNLVERSDDNQQQRVQTSLSVYRFVTCNRKNVTTFIQNNKKLILKDLTTLKHETLPFRDKKKCLLQNFADRNSIEREHEAALRLAEEKQEIELQKFQQEQERLQLEKQYLNQERLPIPKGLHCEGNVSKKSN